MIDFGSRLKQTMAESGYSQKALAEKVGLSDAYISMLCANKNNPSKRTIEDIANTLGVNSEWLLTGNGEKKPEMSREEAIAEMAAKILTNKPGSFVERVVSALSKADEKQLEALDNFLEAIYKSKPEE